MAKFIIRSTIASKFGQQKSKKCCNGRSCIDFMFVELEMRRYNRDI